METKIKNQSLSLLANFAIDKKIKSATSKFVWVFNFFSVRKSFLRVASISEVFQIFDWARNSFSYLKKIGGFIDFSAACFEPVNLYFSIKYINL